MKPTDQEQIWSLERQAQNFWEIMLASGLSDGHCKSYDPLTIARTDGGYDFMSYVFDHGDGERHRVFKTLEEGQDWLLASFADWIKRGRHES